MFRMFPPTFPSSIDERKHFQGCQKRGGMLARLRQTVGMAKETRTGKTRRKGGSVSWPRWCFPRVSMSIYLPGAYSDKSVIAAEASERVARRCRCRHHHQHPDQHHYYQSHIAFTISTPHRGARCACLRRNDRTRHTEFRCARGERMTETNGRTDRRGTEAEVAEWRTRNTERGVGIVREMVEVRERKGEKERRRRTERAQSD